MKILPVGAELLQAHGQRDRHEEAMVEFYVHGTVQRQ